MKLDRAIHPRKKTENERNEMEENGVHPSAADRNLSGAVRADPCGSRWRPVDWHARPPRAPIGAQRKPTDKARAALSKQPK